MLFPGDVEAVLAPIQNALAITQAAPFGFYLALLVTIAGLFALKWRQSDPLKQLPPQSKAEKSPNRSEQDEIDP